MILHILNRLDQAPLVWSPAATSERRQCNLCETTSVRSGLPFQGKTLSGHSAVKNAAHTTTGDFTRVVRKTRGLQPWRRVFHAACGLTMVALVEYGGLDTGVILLLLGGGMLASLTLDWVRLRIPGANFIFFRWFAALASPREARRVASSTWFLMGVLATLLIAPAHLFAPAVLVLALADPAASVVGRLWGGHSLGKGSWEGTITFFLVACAVTFPFVGLPGALVAAVSVAIFEVLPTGVDDNLTVPVATALVLWLVESAGRALAGV